MIFITEFFVYSFFGFIAETAFALATRRVLELRKTTRFLPLCPVYGVGAIAMRLCAGEMSINAPIAFLLGAVVGTAVELLFGIICERLFSVRLWDYSTFVFNYRGHITLPFTLIWGTLGAIFLCFAEPMITPLLTAFPVQINAFIAILLLFDAPFTIHMLKSIGKGSRLYQTDCPVIQRI